MPQAATDPNHPPAPTATSVAAGNAAPIDPRPEIRSIDAAHFNENWTAPEYTILMPVFDDWLAVRKLLLCLDEKLSAVGHVARVLLVNDGSLLKPSLASLDFGELRSFKRATLLTLTTNLGHQRAIAVGLAHIASTDSISDVVIMDSDGEDDPADVIRLVKHAHLQASPTVIFAERTQRSEGTAFRIGYTLFTILFRILTGKRLRFGNFSFVPANCVPRLACMPELWNHYAAAVMKSRVRRTAVRSARLHRLDGQSSMNVASLVLHGLSAISVFGDIVGVRLLFASLAFASACLFVGIAIIAVRFLTTWAIPGWATAAAGIATLLFTNALLFAVSFVFFILSNRSMNVFVPARDFRSFVHKSECFPAN